MKSPNRAAMPVALFVCPHCEKHAEVQVTSVTRSRPCPHCGELVVLQVSARDKGKRRALLVAGADAPVIPKEPAKPVPGPAYEPQLLEGDVLERMKFDPEVQVVRRRLVIGAAGLVAVIVLAIIWHWAGPSVMNKVASAGVVDPEASALKRAVPIDTNALLANAVGMRRGESKAGSTNVLAFEPPTQTPADAPMPAPSSEPPPKVESKAAPVAEAPSKTDGIDASENTGAGSKQVKLTMTDPRIQAAAAMERFLTAKNIDAMLSTVADRPVVEPMIRRYLEQHPIEPFSYESLTISNGAGPTGERSIVVRMRDGSTREGVVIHQDGRSVVDWPSFVAWSDMEWAQFMDQKPSDPVLFRVIAEPTERFDNAFSDSKGLACLKLSNPRNASAAPIFAYAEKTSVVGQEIEFLMKQSEGKPTKLTLHLKYPQAAKASDQVWIDGLLANGWMVPHPKTTAQVSN